MSGFAGWFLKYVIGTLLILLNYGQYHLCQQEIVFLLLTDYLYSGTWIVPGLSFHGSCKNEGLQTTGEDIQLQPIAA